MIKFKKVGIIGRYNSNNFVGVLKRLKKFLLANKLDCALEQSIATLVPAHNLPVYTYDEIGKHCDLAIVIGGDGSMLGAARALADYNIPVLGINRGHLGFLTDIPADELETQIGSVIAGEYVIENRFLLNVTLKRDDKIISQSLALNEIVLHPGKTTRIIDFELFIDDQFVSSQKADGMIVSTPTGSTAYALSGGGPIIHPKLDALLLLPMFPHTLNSRPIVIDGSSALKLVVGQKDGIWPTVTCDGQIHIAAAPNDMITISKKSNQLYLIHPSNYNYYHVCREKLGWDSRLKRNGDA